MRQWSCNWWMITWCFSWGAWFPLIQSGLYYHLRLRCVCVSNADPPHGKLWQWHKSCTTALESHMPWASVCINSLSLSTVAEWREKGSGGIRLLMLGKGQERGDSSKMNLFFPEYFLVAISIGLVQNTGREIDWSGPLTYPLLTSFSNNWTTVNFTADCRLFAMYVRARPIKDF